MGCVQYFRHFSNFCEALFIVGKNPFVYNSLLSRMLILHIFYIHQVPLADLGGGGGVGLQSDFFFMYFWVKLIPNKNAFQ